MNSIENLSDALQMSKNHYQTKVDAEAKDMARRDLVIRERYAEIAEFEALMREKGLYDHLEPPRPSLWWLEYPSYNIKQLIYEGAKVGGVTVNGLLDEDPEFRVRRVELCKVLGPLEVDWMSPVDRSSRMGDDAVHVKTSNKKFPHISIMYYARLKSNSPCRIVSDFKRSEERRVVCTSDSNTEGSSEGALT